MRIVKGAHKVLLEVVVDVACYGLCKMEPREVNLKSSQVVFLGDIVRLVTNAFDGYCRMIVKTFCTFGEKSSM